MSAINLGHRKHLTREIRLLLAPFLLALVVGLLMWRRSQTAPRFLASPVLVSKAYWAGDGRVVAYSARVNLSTTQVATNFLAWRNEDGELITNVGGPKFRTSVVPSPDGKVWATFEQKNSKLQLLDPVRGFASQGTMTLKTAKPSYHYLHWISDDKLLDLSQEMVANAPMKPLVIDTRTMSIDEKQTGVVSKSLPWLKNGIESFQVSPDGKMALVLEMEKWVTLGKKVASAPPVIIVKGRRMSVISWPDCREIKRFDGDLWGPANWSPDSKTIYSLASVEDQGQTTSTKIVRFDVATGKTSATALDIAEIISPKSYIGLLGMDLARLSPDNRFLVVPDIDQKHLTGGLHSYVFDVASGQQVGNIVTPPQNNIAAWSQFWSGLNFSPDGRYLLQPLENGVQIWDMNQFASGQ